MMLHWNGCQKEIGVRLGKSAKLSPDKVNGYGTLAVANAKTTVFGERARKLIASAVLSCMLSAPSRSYSEPTPNHDDSVVTELSTFGKQGDTIARAREQVLEILQHENGCRTWFQETAHESAEMFRSLHFELEEKGPSYVYSKTNGEHGRLLKHPWAARSTQYGGLSSTILLNANGPFFNRTAVVIQLEPKGMQPRFGANRELTISSYAGSTPEAQITILLHELGHITGRLPEDADSWDGRSSRNTSEVLRHCKTEIHEAAHKSSRGSG